MNPEITLESPHDYIKTGERGHKFGIPHDEVLKVAQSANRMRNLELVGLDMHLGSQLSRIDPYRDAPLLIEVEPTTIGQTCKAPSIQVGYTAVPPTPLSHLGGRFSRNAVMPSCASADAALSAMTGEVTA